MQAKTAGSLAWILIYGGMLLGVLGWFVRDAQPALGLALMLFGGIDVVFGIALIVWRSRMPAAAPAAPDPKKKP